MQSVETQALMRDVSIYNIAITRSRFTPASLEIWRAAPYMDKRGVAHVTIAKDTQAMKLGADKPSMENHGLRTLTACRSLTQAPGAERLKRAAALINDGKKVAILVGQGALGARDESDCSWP